MAASVNKSGILPREWCFI